jgi:hypothetical protein
VSSKFRLCSFDSSAESRVIGLTTKHGITVAFKVKSEKSNLFGILDKRTESLEEERVRNASNHSNYEKVNREEGQDGL